MTRICPKCNYVRQSSDNAPDWQCPSCTVAYSKVGSVPSQPRTSLAAAPGGETSSVALKWIMIAVALGAGIWFGKPLWQAARSKPGIESIPAATPAANGQPAVTLYSAEWCGYCTQTRELFVANGIAFVELDVEKTTAGYEGHKKLGGDGVPLIVVGDDLIRGYDESRLRSTLKPWMARF